MNKFWLEIKEEIKEHFSNWNIGILTVLIYSFYLTLLANALILPLKVFGIVAISWGTTLLVVSLNPIIVILFACKIFYNIKVYGNYEGPVE